MLHVQNIDIHPVSELRSCHIYTGYPIVKTVTLSLVTAVTFNICNKCRAQNKNEYHRHFLYIFKALFHIIFGKIFEMTFIAYSRICITVSVETT